MSYNIPVLKVGEGPGVWSVLSTAVSDAADKRNSPFSTKTLDHLTGVLYRRLRSDRFLARPSPYHGRFVTPDQEIDEMGTMLNVPQSDVRVRLVMEEIANSLLFRFGFFPDSMPNDVHPYREGRKAYGEVVQQSKAIGDNYGASVFTQISDGYEDAAGIFEDIRVEAELRAVRRGRADISLNELLLVSADFVELLRKFLLDGNVIGRRVIQALGENPQEVIANFWHYTRNGRLLSDLHHSNMN